MPNDFSEASLREISRAELRKQNRTLTYYTALHAESVRGFVEKMIAQKQVLSFDPRIHNKSVNTLYLYLNRAIMYLVDHLDGPDSRYKNWRDTVMIRKSEKDNTVKIEPKVRSNRQIAARKEEPLGFVAQIEKVNKELMSDRRWLSVLNDWIERGSGEIEIEGLALNKEDLDDVVASVIGLSSVEIVELNTWKIKMAKV